MSKKELITSIYNKNLEVRYNEWYITTKDNKKIKLDLHGKIKCPLINMSISSLCCDSIMERETWPRSIDQNICKKCNCYVYLSIRKFQEQARSTKG